MHSKVENFNVQNDESREKNSKQCVQNIKFCSWEGYKKEIFQIECEVFQSEAWTLQNIEESIAFPLFFGEVAKLDGEVVGYYGMNLIAGEGYIANVAVQKKYQACGVGSVLVSRMLEVCKMQNCEEITLEVRVSNKKAISLYQKFGFIIEGERNNFYPDGEACYIMWKRK